MVELFARHQCDDAVAVDFGQTSGSDGASVAQHGVVIGDGENDVAMFDLAGLSIAMGNAAPEVQQAADLVTGSNADDGFAAAVERLILAPGV